MMGSTRPTTRGSLDEEAASSVLPQRLRTILDAQRPAFSDQEMARRRQALLGLMAERDCSALVAYGSHQSGSAVQWITGWPVTIEAAVLVTPDEPDLLLVQFYNHVPNATELAPRAEVRWGGTSTIASLIQALEARPPKRKRIGVIGRLSHADHVAISSACDRVEDLTPQYRRFRMIKSEEEIDWFRIGAWLSDRAIDALLHGVSPGMTEWELAGIVENAYVRHGGTTLIHFFGVTPMDRPSQCVPAQHPSNRPVSKGDVIVTEISASFWRHPGQVLRTFTVEAEPSRLYRQLHEVAVSVFRDVVDLLRPGTNAADLLRATGQIEEAGFTIYDDLVHGFDGDYLPPVIGSRSRPIHPLPDTVLEEGMTLVVQPNVITRDGRAGVQTGEMMLITQSGAESLHSSPRGLLRVGRT